MASPARLKVTSKLSVRVSSKKPNPANQTKTKPQIPVVESKPTMIVRCKDNDLASREYQKLNGKGWELVEHAEIMSVLKRGGLVLWNPQRVVLGPVRAH
jgi:hypothetical protein